MEKDKDDDMGLLVRESQRIRATIHAHRRGYRATDMGEIVSPRGTCRSLYPKGRKGTKYLCFSVCAPWSDRHCINVPVHFLVAYQKYGRDVFRHGAVVRHLNGNSLDNKVCNIAIGTLSDNRRDIDESQRVRAARVAGRSQSSLSEDNIREIRRLREEERLTYAEILKRFSMAKSTLSAICNYRTWKNV